MNIIGITSSLPNNIEIVPFEYESKKCSIKRHITSWNQTASDLGYNAAKRLIDNVFPSEMKEQIGILIFISRTPDFRSPNTAGILQHRLGLGQDCICYDVNLGSNGFLVGLKLLEDVLDSSNANYGMLIIGDTLSKFVSESQLINITSDSATAILAENSKNSSNIFEFRVKNFTDNFQTFISPFGGFRDFTSLKEFESDKNYTLLLDESKLVEILNSIDAKEYLNYNSEETNTLSTFECKYFYKRIETHSMELNVVYGNADIPIQLESEFGVNNSERMRFNLISVGEGIQIVKVQIELNKSTFLSTEFTNDVYDNFEVNHEM